MQSLAGMGGLAERNSSVVDCIDSGVVVVQSGDKVVPVVNGVEDWHNGLELVW